MQPGTSITEARKRLSAHVSVRVPVLAAVATRFGVHKGHSSTRVLRLASDVQVGPARQLTSTWRPVVAIG